jgi:hypothetical protein
MIVGFLAFIFSRKSWSRVTGEGRKKGLPGFPLAANATELKHKIVIKVNKIAYVFFIFMAGPS